MRIISLAVAVAAAATLLSVAPAANAAPPGSYRQSCRDISTRGWMLFARCSSGYGWRSSSINYRDCNSDIANRNGALVCRNGNPGPFPPRPPWADNDDNNYDNNDRDADWNNNDNNGGYGGGLILFGGRGFSGPSFRVGREAYNLDRTGFNDRAGSVQINRGVWEVCDDAGFGGRCVTLDRSVGDLYRLGMGDSISSVRRLR